MLSKMSASTENKVVAGFCPVPKYKNDVPNKGVELHGANSF